MKRIEDIELPDGLALRRTGAVLTVELQRPAKLNAVTAAMAEGLASLALAANADSDVAVVVLQGEGTKAFSAGSDIGLLDDYGGTWALRNRTDYARAIWSIRKPVIAKVRGYCIGGGLELALMSDIRVADSSAKFGAGEVKLGWHGGAGNTQLLPRLVGSGAALKMLLTGELVPAEEALRLGLVDVLTSPKALDTEVDELALAIADQAPIAVELIKHLVRIAASSSLEVGLAYENDSFTYCMSTLDSREGRQAFLEKRKPRFQGR